MADEGEGTFPFEKLLPELQLELFEHFVDRPTLLSFAMVSAFYRHTIMKFMRYYNPWRFMDDCAERGYLGLLKFAYESGAKADIGVLEAAVESDHEDVVRFLLAILQASRQVSDGNSFEDVKIGLCSFAAQNGNRALVDLLWPQHVTKPNAAVLYAKHALEGGHFALAIDLKEKYFPAFGFSTLFPSRGGHLAAIQDICALSGTTVEEQSHFILQGACEGGQLDLIRFAIDHFAHPKISYLTQEKVLTSPEIFSFFREKYSELLDENVALIGASAAKSPHLLVFQWLIERNYRFTDVDIHIISGAHLLTVKSLKFYRTPPDNSQRFECVKLLHHLGYDFKAKRPFMAAWANLHQLEWILANINPQFDLIEPLWLSHLKRNDRADLGIVRLLFDRSGVVPPSIALECAFMENNLELFELILELFGGDDVKFREWIPDDFFPELANHSKYFVGTGATVLLIAPKRRVRDGNMLKLLAWFVDRGVVLPPVHGFFSVENAYLRARFSEIQIKSANRSHEAKTNVK